MFPQPKLPQFKLPQIKIPLHIPHVGCPGADGRSYIGDQFGSLPDLYDALHIKHLRKVINDQIYALLKGKLPTILRKVLYAQKALELIAQIVEVVEVLNQVIARALAEYNAAVSFINQKKAQLQAAITAVEAIPVAARTATQTLAIERYHEYLGELDTQISKLQTSIACIAE